MSISGRLLILRKHHIQCEKKNGRYTEDTLYPLYQDVILKKQP